MKNTKEAQRITSWTNNELLYLVNPDNHRFQQIGDYFYWFRKYNDNDEEMLDKDFHDINQAKEFMHYNIYLWTKELFDRITNKAKAQKGADNYSAKAHTLHEQIRNAHIEFPYLTHKRLAEHFNCSTKTIQRAINKS